MKAPQCLRADLKTLHRQLEELYARVQAERASSAQGSKRKSEPASFTAGR